jgi:hypothetical protein
MLATDVSSGTGGMHKPPPGRIVVIGTVIAP